MCVTEASYGEILASTYHIIEKMQKRLIGRKFNNLSLAGRSDTYLINWSLLPFSVILCRLWNFLLPFVRKLISLKRPKSNIRLFYPNLEGTWFLTRIVLKLALFSIRVPIDLLPTYGRVSRVPNLYLSRGIKWSMEMVTAGRIVSLVHIYREANKSTANHMARLGAEQREELVFIED